MTRHPVDVVLRRAAEIARDGPYRWAKRKSTQMILRAHREDLCRALASDLVLRQKTRASMQRNRRYLTDPRVLTLKDLDAFTKHLEVTTDQQRSLAAGLLHDSPAIVAATLGYLQDPNELPEPAPPPQRLPEAASAAQDGSDLNGEDQTPAPDGAAGASENLPDPDGFSERLEELAPALARAEQERNEARVQAAELEGRLNGLASELAKLKEAVPTKRQVRRQHRQLKDAERALARYQQTQERIVALKDDVERLELQLALARDERDEVEADLSERLREQTRVRQTLERRLGHTGSRAYYLRTAVHNEIASMQQEMADLGLGRQRTRARRRLGALEDLVALLDELYPVGPEPDMAPAEEPRRQLAQVRDGAVTVVPLGGGSEIGGSAVLVEAGNLRVLVDAGLRPQGGTTADTRPVDIDNLGSRRLDAIIVTHAHTDHSGYVPAVVAQFPNVPVICTPGTAALLPTMWDDSRQVMRRRLEAESRYMEGTSPLYSDAEVQQAEDRLHQVGFNRTKTLPGGATYELFPAGHIVGAAGLVLTFGDRKVVVTGDISDQEQATVGRMNLPASAHNAGLLVIETTYCDQLHRKSRPDQVADLVRAVAEVYDQRGRVLIPAFGLGRAQEVALILHEHLPEVPVLVDGMAARIGQIFERHANDEGRRLRIFDGNIRRVSGAHDRQRLLRTFHSGVIISTSGMMTGGPVMTWALEILPDPAGALFLCGYQDEESPGRRLQELEREARAGRVPSFLLEDRDRQVSIHVHAQVSTYSLSAHADREGLLSIVRQTSPAKTMLVHGEPGPQRRFVRVLAEASFSTAPTGRWQAQ